MAIKRHINGHKIKKDTFIRVTNAIVGLDLLGAGQVEAFFKNLLNIWNLLPEVAQYELNVIAFSD